MASISEPGNFGLALYSYLGTNLVTTMERTEPSLRYDLRTGGTGVFGMDAWDRINDLIWKDFAVSPPQGVVIDRIKYGYDSVGSRTWRENVQDTTNSYDWFYTNDGIDRLDEGQRGQLNGTYTGLSTKKFAQDWTLDAVGNWRTYKQDFTGGGYTFDQARASNLDNEIDTISGSGGADWIDPLYSATGNMTKIPQPGDPTKSFDAKYDAWNRLVELKDTTSTNTVAQYAYDGLFRRTIKKTYTSGTLSETRHFYYSDAWQVLEERIEVSSSQQLNRQYLWGVRYIDELVFRDRDTNNDGTLDERLYALQDANWNVTALWGKNSGGTAWEMKQRFEYNPYGKDEVLTAAFAGSTDAYAWETRYAGYRWDGESETCQVRFRYYILGLGLWGTRDPISLAESIGRLNTPSMYEYGISSPTNNVDTFGLSASTLASRIDVSRCAITIDLRLNVTFNPPVSYAQRATYLFHLKARVENVWNKNNVKISPLEIRCCYWVVATNPPPYTRPAVKFESKCIDCPCQSGFTPKLRIAFNQSAPNFNVVVNGTPGGAFVQPAILAPFGWAGYAEFGSNAIDMTANVLGGSQIAAAHEIGHMLGLEHPGAHLYWDDNSLEAYAWDVNGLMGAGMDLRRSYFTPWADELNEKYPCCAYGVFK